MTEIKKSFVRTSCIALALTIPTASFSLTITTESNGDALADSLFLNLPGVEVTNTEFFGFDEQAGIYTNVIGTYGLPQNGIVLSTGNVLDYQAGGNSGGEISTEYEFFGEEEGGEGGGEGGATVSQQALLGPITGQPQHFDVVQLNIEFETASNVEQVTFFGAFGSEEWPEYVGSYVDGFGLYVNGVNEAGVPEFNGGTPLPVNIDHPSMVAITGTELNGVLAPGSNPVLRFDVPVNPGTTNNFSIILADANDAALDTTVYLSSFIAANPGSGGGAPIPASGATEFDPLLPIVNANGETIFDENGAFIIDIAEEIATNQQTVWIDPPVSVGYTYQSSDGVLFTTVTAPSFATIADIDGYTIVVNGVSYSLAASSVFDIFAETGLAGVEYFEILGIDTSLSLDPSNPLAFPIGVTSNATTGFSLTITPIVEDDGTGGPGIAPVPLPATSLLYLGGILLGGRIMRRRQTTA